MKIIGLFILTGIMSAQAALLSVDPAKTIEGFHYLFKYFKEVEGKIEAKGILVKSETRILLSKNRETFSKEEFKRRQDLGRAVFRTTRGDGDANGTSFLIGRNIVLTNRHVLKPSSVKNPTCNRFRITINNKKARQVYCKEVIACGQNSADFCIVKMHKMRDGKELGDVITPLKLKVDAEFHPNKKVMSIGNPGGYGISAATGVGAVLSKTGVIVHKAPIMPGNSGGPLLDMDGNVIALNYAQSAEYFYGSEAENYSISMEYLGGIIRHLLDPADLEHITFVVDFDFF